MSYKARKLVEKKHKLYAKYKRTDHPAYEKVAREATAELRRSKLNYEIKLAENIKDDSKSFFSYVKCKAKVKAKLGPLVDKDGARIESASGMAESFNEYFSSVFTAEKGGDVPDGEQIFKGTEAERLLDLEITEEMVRAKLLRLRADKSAGVDDMSPRFLKLIQEQLVRPVYLLLRKSLDEGSVPLDWKTANVTPIYKKGCRSRAENYRPVSLTSQICKIVESVIRDAVVKHLEKNALIKNSQHGFRTGRSCLTNLLSFLDKATECWDHGDGMDVIYTDFSKAFDKVPHQRLLKKLDSHGIGGKVKAWVAAWLSNRQQRVCMRRQGSGWRSVISGVPQGSVLGPILFLIFINDIDCGVLNWILKFADDTKLFGKVNTSAEAASLQKDVDTLCNWASTWQMEFNVEKCKTMHLGSRNVRHNYSMNGQKLEEVKSERDLGVIITNDLKVSEQCRQACNRANRMLGLIRRTISSRDPVILTRLYKSLVRPHLEYSSVAWSPHYRKDRDMIEKVQHRFTRLFGALRQLDYDSRLSRLGLWTLEERRNRADLIEVFKMSHGQSPISLDTFFKRDLNSRTRGHSYKLQKDYSKSEPRFHFFSNRVVKRWNLLPPEAVSLTSVNSFKSHLQKIKMTRIDFFRDA